MMLLRWLGRLYSLDTLDARFTTPSTSPPKSPTGSRIDPTIISSTRDGAAHQGRDVGQSNAPSPPSPSRWGTSEFLAYYVIVTTAVLWMFKVSYDVSKESHPNFPRYAPRLSPGWIGSRRVDNSDAQYASFRNNIPYMLIVVIVHPTLRRLYNYLRPLPHEGASDPFFASKSQSVADARLEQRVSFDLWFTVVFLTALHGVSALKILLILYANFKLATRLPQQYIPAVTWIFNISILFANEITKGYRFARIADTLLPWSGVTQKGEMEMGGLKHWAAWLDSFGGLIPRWEVLFNITVLRLISFNLDHYWSLYMDGPSLIEEKKKQLDPANLSERDRINTPARAEDYSFRKYLVYSLYPPLYLAGPILTFNEYIAQLRYPLRNLTTIRTVLYGIRFLLTLLTMELVLHYIYAVAISKSNPSWDVYTPFQLSMLGYFNLHIIWLKLLIPWRFFRLWALIDGVDPPENMVRCMSDNYSALAFWRGWHRSFNRWTIRYIYIPLGGSGGLGGESWWSKARAVRNFLAVFTFVALWHDINLRLLMWGWLVTLFILPEMLAGYLFPRRKWQHRQEAYRIICGVGAVGNILMMMTANLIGFAVGLDGVRGLVHGIVGTYSGKHGPGGTTIDAS
ncbi:MAG: glycerol transporter [Piccolia ochrophora]|nr:MAG: glycerol transporter [Piccolia ochrophora]